MILYKKDSAWTIASLPSIPGTYISQLMAKTGFKHRPNFIEYHLNPAISEGFVRQLYPDKPRHPRQKCLLTSKGLALYDEITKTKI